MEIDVRNEFETAEKIREGFSLARFGDGEINIAYNQRGAFDCYDEQLAAKLREILFSQHEGLLIGLPDIFSDTAKARLTNPGFWVPYEKQMLGLLPPGRVWYSNFFSRPDNCSHTPGTERKSRKEPENVDPAYWALMRSIWEGRDLCVINFNPELARNELFNNAARVQFVECAQRNAWGGGVAYADLLKRCLEVRTDLFLAAVGPLGTVLGHDLHLEGRWALDFGQAARIYYESQGREHMFLY